MLPVKIMSFILNFHITVSLMITSSASETIYLEKLMWLVWWECGRRQRDFSSSGFSSSFLFSEQKWWLHLFLWCCDKSILAFVRKDIIFVRNVVVWFLCQTTFNYGLLHYINLLLQLTSSTREITTSTSIHLCFSTTSNSLVSISRSSTILPNQWSE